MSIATTQVCMYIHICVASCTKYFYFQLLGNYNFVSYILKLMYKATAHCHHGFVEYSVTSYS